MRTELRDGSRASAYWSTLVGGSKRVVGDVEYARALFRHVSTSLTESDDLVQKEVASLAADGDLFCFAEKAGSILRAAILDPRLDPPIEGEDVAGAAFLVAPLCLLYSAVEETFLVFRQMWKLLWARIRREAHDSALALVAAGQLHSPAFGGALYEASLKGWLRQGFSGFLPLSQVLVVWDNLVCDVDNATHTLTTVGSAVVKLRLSRGLTEIEQFSDLSDIDACAL